MHLSMTAWHDQERAIAAPKGRVDDASRMNETGVREVVDVSPDDAIALAQVRAALARARAAHVGVAIAGFRHSQGGQSLLRDGIVLNMLRHNRIELSADHASMHVQSGAVWRDIIQRLERVGRSVEVMQSDSPFSVGGSLSVNCHGWQHQHEPLESTVLAMNVVLADGSLVHCSRTERPDLFAHVLGGYGLFGVILDAEVRTVPNERYRVVHAECDVSGYEETLARQLKAGGVIGMAYGRISVEPDTFLRQSIVTTFVREPGPIPPLRAASPNRLERIVFRGTVTSDYGKQLRWQLERGVAPLLEPSSVSRNELLNGDIEVYLDHGPDSTDILHEYFVPEGKLSAFIDKVRPILITEKAELLNVTVRDVLADQTTALPYARQHVFAIVMFFHQERTRAGDVAMERLTQKLIDQALSAGGTYYLPYRLHATKEQFRRAYPMAGDFLREKRRLDPEELFRNEWFERYGH